MKSSICRPQLMQMLSTVATGAVTKSVSIARLVFRVAIFSNAPDACRLSVDGDGWFMVRVRSKEIKTDRHVHAKTQPAWEGGSARVLFRFPLRSQPPSRRKQEKSEAERKGHRFHDERDCNNAMRRVKKMTRAAQTREGYFLAIPSFLPFLTFPSFLPSLFPVISPPALVE